MTGVRPTSVIPPVRRQITVPWAVDAAFRRFTAELESWWPLRSHSVGQANAARCGIDPRVGGQIYEESRDGIRTEWGVVTVWDPPRRVGFTWHPGEPSEMAQHVEVSFTPDGPGTKLELVHSGWERLGEKLGRGRSRGYGLGWRQVLNVYAGHPYRPLNLLLNTLMLPMRVPRRVWFGVAIVLTALAATGAVIAYQRAEMIPGTLFVLLTGLCGWWARRMSVSPPTALSRAAG